MVRKLSASGLLAVISPAYAAALALVIIQVGIGLMYKAAQTGGKYAFSPTSSVTISESLKFLLSTFLFYRDWRTRKHQLRPIPPLPSRSQSSIEDGKGSREDDSSSLLSDDPLHEPEMNFGRRTFWQAIRDEIPVEIRYGFAHLALFYTLINNIVFVLFRLADPGTIQLIKSGTTLITALVMIVSLGTHVALGQWVAICFQVCGIVVTQYKPSGGSAYPVSTYLILLFQTTLSAVSSVYNQKLCKSSDGSLHVMNMSLYGCGAVINLVLHIVVRIINSAEPGFFTGYGTIGAIMVIVSNVFIGLAMTAVYKYADALIKCFATALSTACLLYLSPLLFEVEFSFLVIPGSCVVFLATWLYMDSTPPKPAHAVADMKPAEQAGARRSFIGRIGHSLTPHGSLRRLGLIMTTSVAFSIIFAVTYYRTHMMPGSTLPEIHEPVIALDPAIVDPGTPDSIVVKSPFDKTVVFIRHMHEDKDRAKKITDAYQPFFRNVHVSMANPSHNEDELDLDRDYHRDIKSSYRPIIKYLQMITKDPSYKDVTGMVFMKADSWLLPLQFGDMNFDHIWTLDNKGGPPFICQTEIKRMQSWNGLKEGWHYKGKDAVHRILELIQYKVNPEEFCMGWTDMFYLPRHFFSDFLALAPAFVEKGVPDEVTFPTIWHIIDQTYQIHRSQPLITRWADCLQVVPNVTPEDVMEHRCGSRIEDHNSEEAKKLFETLSEDTAIIGKSLAAKHPTLRKRTATIEDAYGMLML